MQDGVSGSDATETGRFETEALLDLPLLKVRDLGNAAERLLEARLAERDISSNELRVLAACAAQPGITAVEVSRLSPVEPPAVSRLVHSLSQKGLLSRRRSRTDRREVRLRATDAGLALLEECRPLLERAQADFLADLGEPQARAFLCAVTVLLSANG